MNKKYLYIAAMMVLTSLPVAAQETYENAKIASTDLNGTARYVVAPWTPLVKVR